MEEEVIYLSDSGPPEFNKDAWIGKGHSYPEKAADVPIGLSYYVGGLLAIPDEVRGQYLPNPKLSIKAFASQELPKMSYGLVTVNPQSSFHKEAPNTDSTNFLTLKLPPAAWLNGVK
ncbi:hypothetical protein CPB84DRAFT_1857539 [Gymnopilus junonius]|uniref:Uncharacterized protein n=1 Tax=Gymnopilus junonius TaxID=109634 RepID=A0A9P5TFB2_GYMJU|nr:hypothetical protein CPB84DRAFT_1857539 [Gymnopilus junonius]